MKNVIDCGLVVPGVFHKARYSFLPYPSLSRLNFHGNWIHQDGHAIGLDATASLEITLPEVTEVYGRFVRHDWSGKIKVTVDGQDRDCFDLFSPYRFEQCVPLIVRSHPGPCLIRIEPLGVNPSSKSNQIVFVGLFLLKHEAAFTPAVSASPNAESQYYEVQAGMVDRYAQSLADRGVDLEEEAVRRWTKYRKRMREMLVYTRPGDRLLDIGAGFLSEEFVRELFISNGLDYWVQDIDNRVVEHDRGVFERCNLDVSKVRQGSSTALAYEDGSFDLIFSSHCLEHSEDITSTFHELTRILRPGGHIFFAVPFGFDEAIEHPYSIDPDAWYTLTERFGLEVIAQQISSTYAEGRHDLVIVSRKA